MAPRLLRCVPQGEEIPGKSSIFVSCLSRRGHFLSFLSDVKKPDPGRVSYLFLTAFRSQRLCT